MEKIRLKNGSEFDLIQMGASHDVQNKSRRFDVITELSYDALEALMLDKESIKVIQYLSNSGDVLGTYTDCVALKSITKERGKYITNDSVAHDVFTIVLNTDATVTQIRVVEEKIQALRLENDTLKEENLLSELDTDYRLSILELGI